MLKLSADKPGARFGELPTLYLAFGNYKKREVK